MFSKTYEIPIVQIKIKIKATTISSSMVLLINRNFFNAPCEAAIVILGRNAGGGGLNFKVSSSTQYIAVNAESIDESELKLVISTGGYGNALGTIRISYLQKTPGIEVVGEA